MRSVPRVSRADCSRGGEPTVRPQTRSVAATESLGQTLGKVTGEDWIAVLVLSGMSGLFALLNRLRRSMEASALAAQTVGVAADSSQQQLIDWRVFAAAQLTGAFFVGAMLFLLCEAADANNYLEAAVIALGSWSGAKLADRMADSVSDGVVRRINQAFGEDK